MSALDTSFLRHIERCKVLVPAVGYAGTDGRDAVDDYKNLLSELGLYDPGLLDRPRMVVGNKMDEAVAEENLKKFKRRILQDASAANGSRLRRRRGQVQASHPRSQSRRRRNPE